MGCMIGIDKNRDNFEKRWKQRLDIEKERKDKRSDTPTISATESKFLIKLKLNIPVNLIIIFFLFI